MTWLSVFQYRCMARMVRARGRYYRNDASQIHRISCASKNGPRRCSCHGNAWDVGLMHSHCCLPCDLISPMGGVCASVGRRWWRCASGRREVCLSRVTDVLYGPFNLPRCLHAADALTARDRLVLFATRRCRVQRPPGGTSSTSSDKNCVNAR